MAAWTAFDTDNDKRKCNTSSSVAKKVSQVPENKSGLKPYSALGDSNVLPVHDMLHAHRSDRPLSHNFDDENCTSLPAGGRDPCLRSLGRASLAKCSSSCENLDVRCCQRGNTRDNSQLTGVRSNLYKASSDNPVYDLAGAPPVPPRDYISNKILRRPAEIHPIVQNGQQLTHTHYWLLPDKLSRKFEDSSDENEPPESYMNVIPPTPIVSESSTTKSPLTSTSSVESPLMACIGALRKAVAVNSSSGSDAIHLLSDEAELDTTSVDLQYGTNEEFDNSAELLSTKSDSDTSVLNDLLLASREGAMSMKDVNDLVREVQSLVEGVAVDESYAALSIHSWKVSPAVKYLKIEHLFRLGMASRSKCQNFLERHDWNIERAASDMLDQSTTSRSSSKLVSSTVARDLSSKSNPPD